MIRSFLFVLVLVGAMPVMAHAKTWGPATAIKPGFDRQAHLDDIFERLKTAPDEISSRLIVDKLWLTWMTAPDEAAAESLNQALRARGGYNFDKALGILDALIERLPDYAESWNQRSYIHFLKKDYDKSLLDCEKALELEPRHIGCLSGMARILIRHQKRYRAGKSLLDRAMDLHPWIHERVLLKEIPETDL